MGWSGEGDDQPMNGDGLSCLWEWQEIARRFFHVMLRRADIAAHDFGGKLRHCAELPPIVFRRLLPERCVGTPHLLGGLGRRETLHQTQIFFHTAGHEIFHSRPKNQPPESACFLDAQRQGRSKEGEGQRRESKGAGIRCGRRASSRRFFGHLGDSIHWIKSVLAQLQCKRYVRQRPPHCELSLHRDCRRPIRTSDRPKTNGFELL